jgi:uncharacterized protein (DUF1499 family)
VKILLTGLVTVSLFSGCAGNPPGRLGLSDDGALSPCPSSPNCVSSQATDDAHFIEPFRYETDFDTAREALMQSLSDMRRVSITAEEARYIRAEARTRVLRFVDDLEFSFPEGESVIHVRSASRVGHSDLGVNRKRMEELRATFSAAAGGSGS